MLFCFLHNHGGVCTVVRLFAGLYESTYLIVVFLVLLLSFKVYHMYTFLYKGPNSMVLHFFLRDCLLYKVNILFLMMDMSVLAWACPQNLGAPSGHANNRISLVGIRRKCWRGHARKPLKFRRSTPTRAGFSRPAGAFVGAFLPTKPLSSVGARQQLRPVSRYPAQMLAWAYPQTLEVLPEHANMLRIFPTCRRLCWRLPPRKAFVLRRGTPTIETR